MPAASSPSGSPSPDWPSAMGAHVLGIDHVGVAVADIDEGVARYGQLLGLVELHRELNQEQGVLEVMLGSPGRPDAPPLQLIAPAGADSPLQRFLDRRGSGLQQLAYRVDDVDEVGRVLAADGVRLLYDRPRVGTAGSRINFIHPSDGGGVLIELVEPARPPTPADRTSMDDPDASTDDEPR